MRAPRCRSPKAACLWNREQLHRYVHVPHVRMGVGCRRVFLCSPSTCLKQTVKITVFIAILSMCPNFFHLLRPSWLKCRTNTECFDRKLFDSCSLNAISFRADLRALPLKYSATDSRLRVQATRGLTSTDEHFSLATATSLSLTSHGEVRFLPGK